MQSIRRCFFSGEESTHFIFTPPNSFKPCILVNSPEAPIIGPDKMTPSMAAVDTALRGARAMCRETIFMTWISKRVGPNLSPLFPGTAFIQLAVLSQGTPVCRRELVKCSRVTIALACSRSRSTDCDCGVGGGEMDGSRRAEISTLSPRACLPMFALPARVNKAHLRLRSTFRRFGPEVA